MKLTALVGHKHSLSCLLIQRLNSSRNTASGIFRNNIFFSEIWVFLTQSILHKIKPHVLFPLHIFNRNYSITLFEGYCYMKYQNNAWFKYCVPFESCVHEWTQEYTVALSQSNFTWKHKMIVWPYLDKAVFVIT